MNKVIMPDKSRHSCVKLDMGRLNSFPGFQPVLATSVEEAADYFAVGKAFSGTRFSDA